jgi:hypothetical protein
MGDPLQAEQGEGACNMPQQGIVPGCGSGSTQNTHAVPARHGHTVHAQSNKTLQQQTHSTRASCRTVLHNSP